MDEIGDEFSDKPRNDKSGEELPELTNESDELKEIDDDPSEVFSEPDEFGDILDDVIHDKEVGERADEDQDSGDVGNVIENENIGSQSTSTVLTSEIEEIEDNMGY